MKQGFKAWMIMLIAGCGDDVVRRVPDRIIDAGTMSQPDSGSEPERTEPEIEGFDLEVRQGAWWEYEGTSVWRGQLESTWRVRITLERKVTLQGIEAWQVRTERNDGATTEGSWTHLAFEGHRILGSKDGVELVPIFDAWNGRWPGADGFWGRNYGSLLSAEPNGERWEGHAVYEVTQIDIGGCEVVPGYGPVCGDDDPLASYMDVEKYAAGIGPVYHKFTGCVEGGCIEDSDRLVAYSLTGATPPPLTPPQKDVDLADVEFQVTWSHGPIEQPGPYPSSIDVFLCLNSPSDVGDFVRVYNLGIDTIDQHFVVGFGLHSSTETVYAETAFESSISVGAYTRLTWDGPICRTLHVSTSKEWYIFVYADSRDEIVETDEENNSAIAGSPLTF